MNATPVPTQIRRAEVAWKEDGTPWSPAYGDVFHSRAGGLAQTEHVFIQGNDLPARWAQGQAFRVGELGLGSGLNFLCTVQRFLQCSPAGSQLNYVGIEAEPWTPADVQQLLQDGAIDPALLQQWLEALDALQPGANRLLLAHGRVRLSLFVGRVEDCLPQLRAQMDAWYLDGFNPASNQAMWQADLFGALARCTAPGGSLATWCCAGQVRRDLQAAGFALQKAPGFAHKREMLCGRLPGQSSTTPAEAVVEVIGAGLAGCWQARVLAERGCQVEVYDSAKGPAQGASQMPMLIVRPYARHRDTPTARFFWQAAHWAAQRSQEFLGDGWHAGPVWREFGSERPHWLEPAGWYPGQALCAALLEHPNIRSHWSCPAPVAREHPRIWCTGVSPSEGLHRPRAIRGQQSLWPAGAGQLQGHTPRVGDCVAAESAEGLYFGASRVFDDLGAEHRPEEALDYGSGLPRPPCAEDLQDMQHWASTRYQARDRLPLCGPEPEMDGPLPVGLEAGRAQLQDLPARAGTWINLAHAARGATSAPLCAELLADQILGQPLPLLGEEVDALDPRRFWLRAWRRGQWKPSAQPRGDGT